MHSLTLLLSQLAVRVGMSSLSSMVALIVLVAIVIIVSLKARRHPLILASSPLFMSVMLVGLALEAAAVIFMTIPQYPAYCFLKTLCFHVGFDMIVCSMLAKNCE